MNWIVSLFFVICSAFTISSVYISNFIVTIFRVDASSYYPGNLTFQQEIDFFKLHTFVFVVMLVLITFLLKLLFKKKGIPKKSNIYIYSISILSFITFLIFTYMNIFHEINIFF